MSSKSPCMEEMYSIFNQMILYLPNILYTVAISSQACSAISCIHQVLVLELGMLLRRFTRFPQGVDSLTNDTSDGTALCGLRHRMSVNDTKSGRLLAIDSSF